MPSAERQRIIETNKSLRVVKNELESLLEKGAISDTAFDTITSLLPAESPLSGPAGSRSTLASPVPTASGALQSITPARTPVNQPPGPPSYAQSTGSTNGNQAPPPPPQPALAPSKPVLTHARALYHYAASDARDCSFERDDRVAVFEYMNADWWMGQNLRTGQEGIFPRTYVAVEPNSSSNEKATGGMPVYGGAFGQQDNQQNPYNSNVPPMAVAEQASRAAAAQQQGGVMPPGKFEAGAKKFGKKLGNAAIFGAGMTIGSDIVNAIL